MTHCANCEDPNDLPACDARRDGYGCTREKGHSGVHVACGTSAESHGILSWEDPE